MANSTGQNCVDDARSRAGYQNTAFVTDPEILVWVNDSRRELYDIINSQDESIYSSPYVFAMPDPVLATAYAAASLGTPPLNFAALPDDCDHIQGLDFYGPAAAVPGTVRPTTVHMFSVQNRNDLAFRYKAMGRVAAKEIVQVIPFEQSQGNYLLWYTPLLVNLTLLTSLDNIQQRFSDFIGVTSAIRILAKAKRDTSALDNQKDRLERRVRTMSNNRDSEAEQGGTDASGHYTGRWPFSMRRLG